MKNEIKEFNEEKYVEMLEDGTLYDYITNLQEEVEDLREDNYAYHQLMKMQNKREYRSKFLKEFQEEFGTNTFPDYDEIYKRYDKVKKENERFKKENIKLYKKDTKIINELKEKLEITQEKWNKDKQFSKCRTMEMLYYKSRCENAQDLILNELSHLKANDEETWNKEFYDENNKLDYRKLCIELLNQVINLLDGGDEE